MSFHQTFFCTFYATQCYKSAILIWKYVTTHLVTENSSILLNFYQQAGLCLINSRPTKAEKAIKRQNFKKSLISLIFNVKSLINGKVMLRISLCNSSAHNVIHGRQFSFFQFLKARLSPQIKQTNKQIYKQYYMSDNIASKRINV